MIRPIIWLAGGLSFVDMVINGSLFSMGVVLVVAVMLCKEYNWE